MHRFYTLRIYHTGQVLLHAANPGGVTAPTVLIEVLSLSLCLCLCLSLSDPVSLSLSDPVSVSVSVFVSGL